MRRADDSTPEPFHIRFSPAGLKQAAALSADARERLSRRLIQLADLAAFAVLYSISVRKIESLVAEGDGLSIQYQIDEIARTLTALEIVETGAAASDRAVHRIK